MTHIIAVVGMCGAGKSIACDVLAAAGYHYIRFGQITIDALKETGQAINPENEKRMRESLRQEHGMGAFATLSLPKIQAALESGHVVIDGLYSWTEYKILEEHFGEALRVLAVQTSPSTRYQRLADRQSSAEDPNTRMRPLTPEQARARDHAELENIEKGGPIAMADITILNEGTVEALERQVRALIDS